MIMLCCRYEGGFGQFKTDRYILFNVSSGIDLNLVAILPCIALGLFGGCLGAAFTFLNLKITRFRRRVHAAMTSDLKVSLVKVTEPTLILLISVTFAVLLPMAFPCTPVGCASNPTEMPKRDNGEQCFNTSRPVNNILVQDLSRFYSGAIYAKFLCSLC